MGQGTCPFPISADSLVGLNSQAHIQHGVIFWNGKLDVAALVFHHEHLAAQSFDERRVIGAYEALRERRRVRATIHARTEHLRRLRIPEHAAVGGSHNATIFDHFERVNRRRSDNRAIGVERAFERVDGMRDELWGASDLSSQNGCGE